MAFKTTLQVLTEMRAILTPEGAWTQHAEARNDRGDDVSPWGDTATCFCVTGAWRRASKGTPHDAVPLNILSEVAGMNIIETWNDVATRTQDDVLRVIDRGIEIASVSNHWFTDSRAFTDYAMPVVA